MIFSSTKLISRNISKKESGKWVKKMQAGFAENAFSYMLTLRLIPIFPFVIVNLVSGMLHIPLQTFFFGTLIGIIPSTIIYASIGVSLQKLLNEPDFAPSALLDPQIIFSLTELAIIALLPIIYKRFKREVH